jgi:hypothetical protein
LLVTYLVLLLFRRSATCSGFAACDSLFGAVRGSDTTRLYKHLGERRYHHLRHGFALSSEAWDRRGGSDTTSDFRKLESPSAEQNKGPIWEVLARHVLPPIVEGALEHAAQNHDRRESNDDDGGNDRNELNVQDAIRVLEIAAGAGGTCDM